MRIEDTSKRDPYLHLLGAMSEGSSDYITGMESAGQAQLVNSDQLPKKMGDRAAYEALGFTFGDATDELFLSATLPQGWKREGSDHAMWSYLVDEHGRRRVAIFYKAAFYDRDAFMRIESTNSYLRDCLYEKRAPVLDDTWLTADTARTELSALADESDKQATEADGYAKRDDDGYWEKQAAKHRADARKARKLAESI